MKCLLAIILSVSSAFASSAYAGDKSVPIHSKECAGFLITISYNVNGKSFGEVGKTISEYSNQIEEYAIQEKFAKPEKNYVLELGQNYSKGSFFSGKDDSLDSRYYGHFKVAYVLDNLENAIKYGDSFARIASKDMETKNREIIIASCSDKNMAEK